MFRGTSLFYETVHRFRSHSDPNNVIQHAVHRRTYSTRNRGVFIVFKILEFASEERIVVFVLFFRRELFSHRRKRSQIFNVSTTRIY